MSPAKRARPPGEVKSQRAPFPLQRVLLWIGLSVVLGGLGVEAQSRYGYGRAVAQLEERLRGADSRIPLAEAQGCIRGLAFKKNEQIGRENCVTYHWPSLLQSFVVQLVMSPANEVTAFNTADNLFGASLVDGPAKPSPPDGLSKAQLNAMIPRPDRGFASPRPGVLALATHDATYRNPAVGGSIIYCGILVRELVRQAFLLSAQQELGLELLDESMGDDVGSDEQPQAFPLEVYVRVGLDGPTLIEVEQHRIDGPTIHRALPPLSLSLDRHYETLLEQVEPLTRNELPALLRELGFEGSAVRVDPGGKVPAEIEAQLHQLDEVTQLAAIRALHQLIRENGESYDRLGALSRAYANLGSLTEVHWRTYPKVYKARSLLYAQRLIALSKGNSWGIAHRGYAWALAGRPQSGLEDLQRAIRSSFFTPQEPPEGWIVSAQAYCDYDLKTLAEATGENAPLAMYLTMLATDPRTTPTEYLRANDRFKKEAPGSARALFALTEMGQLGILRRVTEVEFAESWPALYRRLSQVNGLPAEAAALVQKHAAAEGVLENEPQDRMRLIRLLKAANGQGPGPAVSEFGRLLEEISFLQAAHQFWVVERLLALPTDELVQRLATTVSGHPYEDYVLSGVSSRSEARSIYERLLKKIRPFELDFSAKFLVLDCELRMDREAFEPLYIKAFKHSDDLQHDLLRELADRRIGTRDHLAEKFYQVAPNLPQAVAARIRKLGVANAQESRTLETKFAGNASVLQALGDWYLGQADYLAAERCLNQRVAVAPEVGAYRELARVYAFINDRPKWKQALEQALQMPAAGLEHATIAEEIAREAMHRNEWQEAKPYAEAAAASYSAFGLKSAAHCYEGLGEIDHAEELVSACAKRYEGMGLDWHYWCLRTGRGNAKAARQLAEALVEKLRERPVEEQWALGFYLLCDGKEREAQDLLQQYWDARSLRQVDPTEVDLLVGLNLALLLDAAKNETLRGRVLQVVGGSDSVNSMPQLADLMVEELAHPERPQFLGDRFRRLLSNAVGDGDATNSYYLAGKFLMQHGRKAEGLDFLRNAASSPRFEHFGCLLATLELRKLDEAIPARRPFVLAGDLSDMTLIRDELRGHWNAKRYTEIVTLLTREMASHPAWTFLEVERGVASARLGNYREAIADWEQALQRDPDDLDALYQLALVRAECPDEQYRNADQALEYAQRAFDSPVRKTADGYVGLSAALAVQGNLTRALEFAKKAYRIATRAERLEIGQRIERLQKAL